ncbi:unnamed protein product [Dracunculus medinensis]|uniref:hydroxymethylglutaryl-CoA lyase n=1 Tax=Dracunculus medinensis TaxID=318479 RepID=A0A0N4U685_DRAME|nr:unnamed protein product [Dracunculus medinensis]
MLCALQDSAKDFKVVEVGARDGLQNEKSLVPTAIKIELIERLANCGLREVEATSFVSPKWVPQMSDQIDVVNGIQRLPGVSYPVLVPNLIGFNNAMATGCVKEIAVITAASESFSRKNTNSSTEEALKRSCDIASEAIKLGIKVRGYISCVIGCPYDGPVKPASVLRIAEELLRVGCYEVSLGDTIGVGSAGSVNRLLNSLLNNLPVESLAVHFHDTYGQALANVLTSIERGIRIADSSIAGLGGCPYAKGASGNMATEDLIYMLNDLGVNTVNLLSTSFFLNSGVDLDSLIEVGEWICTKLNRLNGSKTATAMIRKRCI